MRIVRRYYDVELLLVLFSIAIHSCLGISHQHDQHDHHHHQHDHHHQKHDHQQPNFVIILTDDLDWTLGGGNASTLHRTRHLIGDAGTTFDNWFVQTPVCCPSRAELLTGKTFHNLRLPNVRAKHGCMHVDVQAYASHPFYRRDYFAQFFAELNYTVGIFGKHLNNDNPQNFMPSGVDTMLINGGGVYLDPSFTVGTRGTDSPPRYVKFDNCTESTGMLCYSTSIIGNTSLAWINRHLQNSYSTDEESVPIPKKPFLALIAPKAPHLLDGPGFPLSTPAPWYKDTSIVEQYAPRTPHYNLSALDHHWLVRSQQPLTQSEARKVDDLYVSRLKTMVSVDDLVQELVHTLEERGVLNETYIIFTSDNGYRLGQFRMPVGKFHPYENDIRVPMMIRGPGIPAGSRSSLLSTHVNLMPTLLGFATGQYRSQDIVPPTMDGSNLAAHILEDNFIGADTSLKHRQEEIPPPTALLVEYMSLGSVYRYNHTVDTYNNTFLALRILMPSSTTTTTTTDDTGGRITHTMVNYKYAEFRDARNDWNCSRPPLEREFYDLDLDPYEIHNLIPNVSPRVLQLLHAKMQRMFHCQGESCRREQATGLDFTAELQIEASL